MELIASNHEKIMQNYEEKIQLMQNNFQKEIQKLGDDNHNLRSQLQDMVYKNEQLQQVVGRSSE